MLAISISILQDNVASTTPVCLSLPASTRSQVPFLHLGDRDASSQIKTANFHHERLANAVSSIQSICSSMYVRCPSLYASYP